MAPIRPRRAPTVLGLACLALGTAAGAASAQGVASAADIDALRTAIERQQRQLQEQQAAISRQQRLIEAQSREIEALRGGTRAAPMPPAPRAQAQAPAQQPSRASQVPQQAQQPSQQPASARPSTASEAAAAQRQEERRILQTDPTLARVGGVLTPRGAISVEPSIEYAYAQTTQTTVNGFSIIPGITFGTVDLRRVQSRNTVAALTLRYGLTDRMEINARIPWLYRNNDVTTGPVDVDASPINIGPKGSGIGDIEVGASYQLNAGLDDWPVFIANLRVKSITGTSPFDVPIYTANDRQGGFLLGLERNLPTGTGFWSVEPGLTVAWATDPAVFFGGIRYIWNADRTVDVQNVSGGPPTSTKLDPGDGIGLNFGVGFAMNERTSLSFSYDHTFVGPSSSNGQRIGASSYDLGVFNFGLSYRYSDAISFNLGVGVGTTEAAPATRILFRVPIRFNLL